MVQVTTSVILFFIFIFLFLMGARHFVLTFTVFGATFINVFILKLSKKEKDDLGERWSSDLINKYESIQKERTELFITGFSIGLILSWVLKYVGVQYNWGIIQIILGMFIMFVISIIGVYFLNKPDKMLKYLKTPEEIQTHLMIQEKMRWRYMVAILFVICVFPLAIYYDLKEEGIKQFLRKKEYYWSGTEYYEPMVKLKIIKKI